MADRRSAAAGGHREINPNSVGFMFAVVARDGDAEFGGYTTQTVSDPHWADAWLYAVLAEPKMTAGAKSIATLLRLHLNVASWTASPSLEGLAARSCQTNRAVEKQRAQLGAKGFLNWAKGRGRVRIQYRLLITETVRRELARIYPEHTAVVETRDNPEQAAVVETAVDKSQPRTLVPATPNRRTPNPRRTAGQTRKPSKTLPPPRTADEARNDSEPERQLRSIVGNTAYDAYLGLGKAKIESGPPVRIVASTVTIARLLQGDSSRVKFPPVFDMVFGKNNWIIIAPTVPA